MRQSGKIVYAHLRDRSLLIADAQPLRISSYQNLENLGSWEVILIKIADPLAMPLGQNIPDHGLPHPSAVNLLAVCVARGPEMTFTYNAIGSIRSPFREKFGVPRQSLMMDEARAIVKLNADPSYPLALSQLEQFSHIWIIFDFHKNGNSRWHPLIDTPRIEAGQRMGVFATRSPHRPNSIGMSAVKLERIDFDATGGIEIHLNGVDLLDGTPVLDIKPYVPYADCIPDANSGWIKTEIEKFPVRFDGECLVLIEEQAKREHPRLKLLIEQMLELDPRPTSQRRATPISDPNSEGLRFAFRVMGLDVHWEIRQKAIFVFKVLLLDV